MNPELDCLSRLFLRSAERETRGSSPLYERLSLGIADDPEMLALAAQSRILQPAPNMLFAAVHWLLLEGADHDLAAFFPSVRGGSVDREDPYPYFCSFCVEHRREIIDLMSSRRVQTNEVRRAACLLPAFGTVVRRTEDTPLSLVEIGASAGLNLLLDRYRYDYGGGLQFGDTQSRVRLSCALKGSRDLPLQDPFPSIAMRVGLDLDPVDVLDPVATSWLRALVWLEQLERAENLRLAIELAKEEPPTLIAGDVLCILPGVLAEVPRELALCIFHTYIYQQFPESARLQLETMVEEHARERDIFFISIEWRARFPTVEIIVYRKGSRTHTLLGYCDSHATWLEWL